VVEPWIESLWQALRSESSEANLAPVIDVKPTKISASKKLERIVSLKNMEESCEAVLKELSGLPLADLKKLNEVDRAEVPTAPAVPDDFIKVNFGEEVEKKDCSVASKFGI